MAAPAFTALATEIEASLFHTIFSSLIIAAMASLTRTKAVMTAMMKMAMAVTALATLSLATPAAESRPCAVIRTQTYKSSALEETSPKKPLRSYN